MPEGRPLLVVPQLWQPVDEPMRFMSARSLLLNDCEELRAGIDSPAYLPGLFR